MTDTLNRDRALCRQHDPELFFPVSSKPVDALPAKRVCDACPITAECLEWAIENRVEYGVWGGATPDERVRIYRRRYRQARREAAA